MIDDKLVAVTPVTPAFAKSLKVGVTVALVPSYRLIRSIASKRDCATAPSTIERNSDKESIPDPSAPLARIAARTSARFASVTPVIPRAAKSAGVSAGTAAVPPASPMNRVTIEANAASS